MRFRDLCYIAIAALSLLHIYQFYGRMQVNLVDMPVDARNIYLLVHTGKEGRDFYQDRNVKRAWVDIINDENLNSTTPPGLPYSAVLYPPQTWTQFYFLKWIAWKDFRWVVYVINALLIIAILFLIIRIKEESIGLLSVLVPILAFKGT
ncbi:MAG: hypothetical protein AAGK97_17370, partial [Bacteroidota bacterium]